MEDKAFPFTVREVGTFPANAEFITLFCTGFVLEELKEESTTVLFAPVAIPSNFVLSSELIKPSLDVVATVYVVLVSCAGIPRAVISLFVTAVTPDTCPEPSTVIL